MDYNTYINNDYLPNKSKSISILEGVRAMVKEVKIQ